MSGPFQNQAARESRGGRGGLPGSTRNGGAPPRQLGSDALKQGWGWKGGQANVE